jgi:FtsH-binding integral membrane protein
MLQVNQEFCSADDNTTLIYEILKSIKWARKTYGNLPVNVVGHSIGGDLASFCALDLFVSIFNLFDLLHQISIYALQITCTCFLIPSHVLLIYQMVGFIDMSTFFTYIRWLASLISLHFLHVKFGSQDVELMTFGQPRIGNPAFVVCFGEQVPRTIHVTHRTILCHNYHRIINT